MRCPGGGVARRHIVSGDSVTEYGDLISGPSAYRPRVDERFSSQSITARGSSTLFAARSAAVDSDAAGAAVAAGVAGVTANSGRVSAVAVAGALTGTNRGVDSRTAVGAGLTAGAPRISATRLHAAIAVSNPARGIPNGILFVTTEIMVGTPFVLLPREIQPGSATWGEQFGRHIQELPRRCQTPEKARCHKAPPLCRPGSPFRFSARTGTHDSRNQTQP